MDPITITTTLITLATALKDIINIAQEIRKSINKVPQNRVNIRKLSDEVVRDLGELKKFYDAREHLLEGSTELKDALTQLYSHMRGVHARCRQLFTPEVRGRINKVVAAFKVWSKCDEVEAKIVDLKEEVQACYIRFTAFAVARLEGPVHRIATSTARIEETLLVLDKNQRTGLNRMEGLVTSLQISSEQVQSTSPDIVQLSTNDVAAMYLHQQIETITESLDHLASSSTFQDEQPRGSYLLPFKSIIIGPSINTDNETRHREVVGSTLEIIRLLQDDNTPLSIQEGAWDMVNLAIHLHGLEMYSDAMTIGKWAVDLYRTLVTMNPQIYEPYLTLSLRNLSRYKSEVGDHDGALLAIEECVTRQSVQPTRPSVSHNIRLELASSLIELWHVLTRNGDTERKLEIAQKSLDILEAIRRELAEWEAWIAESEDILSSPGTSPHYQWDDDGVFQLQYHTGRALHCLSLSLMDKGELDRAYETDKDALATFRDVCERSPGIFDDNVASCLLNLSSPPLCDGRPPLEILDFSAEALRIFRKLYSTCPTIRNASSFVEALWNHALLLHKNGSLSEALNSAKEAVDIIRKSHSDRKLLASALQQSSWSLRRLGQNEMALDLRQEVVEIYRVFISSEMDPTIPDRLCDLASDLQLVGKLEDGVRMCKEAVEKYRAIAQIREDNPLAVKSLAGGLSYLCHCLNVAKEFDKALHAGSEALELYRNLIDNDKSAVDGFLVALRRTSFSTCHSNERCAIRISADIIDDHRGLLPDYQNAVDAGFSDALRSRDYVLGKYQLFNEAVSNSEELVKLLQSAPIEDNKSAERFITALVTHAGNIDDVGRTEEARALCQKAVDIGKAVPADKMTNELLISLSDALASLSSCLHSLGRYGEALTASRQCVDILHECSEPVDDTMLACRLQGLSFHLRRAGDLKAAMEFGEKAVNLCRSSTSGAVFAEARLPYVLVSFATITADARDEPTALVLAQETVDLCHKLRTSKQTLVPWAYAEPIYAQALTGLSSRFSAIRKYDKAEELLIEARSIYKNMVTGAPGYLPRLAQTIDLLAINQCALGHHEEGVQTAKELVDMQQRLEAYNPDLALLVRLALHDLRTSPSQIMLRNALPSCSHSDLVSI